MRGACFFFARGLEETNMQVQDEGFENEPLFPIIQEVVQPLGYEVIAIERLLHREKKLRLFIDWKQDSGKSGIGIQDCIAVTKALDAPLENNPIVDQAFPTGYELEVSSPGIDRPLRRKSDFERFKSNEIRIHTFRPLTRDESKNPVYLDKNPKQKNFIGTLEGLEGDEILLRVDREQVHIPFTLVSKANLEPKMINPAKGKSA